MTARRWWVGLAVLALVASGTGAGQADGPTYGADRVRMWRLVRTTPLAEQPRSGQLEVGFRFSGADLRSVVVMLPAAPARGRWRFSRIVNDVAATVLTWHPSPAYPFVYVSTPAGRFVSPDCPDPTLCRSRVSSSRTYPFPVSVRPGEDVVVAALNIDVTLLEVPRGWRAIEIADPRAAGGDMRLVQGWEVDGATGAYSYQYVNASVERFAGPVDVAGGRYGSWASATLPCDSAALIVPPVVPLLWGGAGVGEGSLTARTAAGRQLSRLPIECTHGRPWAQLAADGGAPVTWRLDGEATGYAVTPNRLLVVSMPKP